MKGISTGDFEEALAALLGKDAVGLSASTVARLKDAWVEEHLRWSKRDLTAKRYVYFWVDGIYVQARLEDDAQCLLVIVGEATCHGADHALMHRVLLVLRINWAALWGRRLPNLAGHGPNIWAVRPC